MRNKGANLRADGKKSMKKARKGLFLVVHPAGIEPTTFSVGG